MAAGTSLSATGIDVQFAGVHALNNVDLELRQGEVLGLIGPNGAGKTTLVNVLTGFQKPTAGSVSLSGEDVTGWSPHMRARSGLSRTFQAVRMFLRLSVRENIELGALGCGIRARDARRRAAELIDLASFEQWADVEARNLPHGVAHYAGILRALACRPSFLLLDEPAAGMHESDTNQLKSFLLEAKSNLGCGVLLIEHDVEFVMSICERVQVLDHGSSIAVGTGPEIQANPAVRTAYLGDEG